MSIEELPHPRLLQDGTEEDEQKDVGRGHADGRGEDALGGLVHEGDDPVEVIAAVPEEAGHRPSVVVVDDEEHGQYRQHEAGDPPGRLEDEDEAEDGEDDVDGLEPAAADGQPIEDDREVDGDGHGTGDGQPVEPGRGRTRLAEAEALDGEAEDEDRADVDAAVDQGRRSPEEGVVDLVEGEPDGEDRQRQRPFRRPDVACARFPVVLLDCVDRLRARSLGGQCVRHGLQSPITIISAWTWWSMARVGSRSSPLT